MTKHLLQYAVVMFIVASALLNSFCRAASMNMVQDIQQRYYIIRRLEQPINTLLHQHQHTAFGSQTGIAKQFHHPVTKRALHGMETKHSLEPFYTVWTDFMSYKFLPSADFMREVLTMLLLIYKELILNVVKEQATATRLLNFIDHHIELLLPKDQVNNENMVYSDDGLRSYRFVHAQEFYELNAILTGHHTLPSLHTSPPSTNVEGNIDTITGLLTQQNMHDFVVDNTMRFYHIQRMFKAIFILARRGIMPLMLDSTIINNFKCAHIRTCLSNLNQARSLNPLLVVWSQLTSYDALNDAVFVQEFIQATILLYHENERLIREKIDVTQRSDEKQQTLLAVYEKIAMMPIPALLDLLDDVVEHYDMLAQQYELRNSDLTWLAWLKQYWWSTPLIVASLVVTFAKHREILYLLSEIYSPFKKKTPHDIIPPIG